MRELEIHTEGNVLSDGDLAREVRSLRPGRGRPYASAKAMIEHARERGLYDGHQPVRHAVLIYTGDWMRLFEAKLGPPKPFFEHALFRAGDASLIVQRATPGGQMAAHFLEKLAALGARSVIALGHAGGIAEETEIGDLVLFDSAIAAGGAAEHYTDAIRCTPNRSLFASLRRYLHDHDNVLGFARGWFCGATLSTDSFFREQEERIDLCRRAGVIAVESEAASLFAAGAHLGIETAAFAVVSNLIRPGSWQQDYFGRRVYAAKVAMVEVALAAVRSA